MSEENNLSKQLEYLVTSTAGVRLPQPIEIYFNQVLFLSLRKENEAFRHMEAAEDFDRWFSRICSQWNDIRQTLRAIVYHCDNVRNYERRIGEAVAPLLEATERRGFTIGAGQHEKLDAEFHAYLFAVARLLEYLCRAVAAYFRLETRSLRKLLPKLESAEPRIKAASILNTIQSFEDQLGRFWVRTDSVKPTRDWLAHYHYVQSGCLNMMVTMNGTVCVSLFGGPDKLGFMAAKLGPDWDDGGTKILTPLSDQMLDDTEALTRLVLQTFDALGLWHHPSGGLAIEFPRS